MTQRFPPNLSRLSRVSYAASHGAPPRWPLVPHCRSRLLPCAVPHVQPDLDQVKWRAGHVMESSRANSIPAGSFGSPWFNSQNASPVRDGNSGSERELGGHCPRTVRLDLGPNRARSGNRRLTNGECGLDVQAQTQLTGTDGGRLIGEAHNLPDHSFFKSACQGRA